MRSNNIVINPHPLNHKYKKTVVVEVGVNATLLDAIQPQGVTSDWIVELDGYRVPAILWGRTRVKAGVQIECKRVVQKEIITTIAIIALNVFAPGIGTAISAALFGGSLIAASIITGVIVAGGSYIINKLTAPKQEAMDMGANAGATSAGGEGSVARPTYSLQGGRNQGRPWQVMGLVLGEPYLAPDLASQPWAYFNGDDQMLSQLFHLGVNCNAVRDIKIGQTSIDTYSDVTFAAVGLAGNSYSADLPQNNVDSIAASLLDHNVYVTRTSSVNAVRLGVDLEANIYGFDKTTGNYIAESVVVLIQYKLTSASTWTNLNTAGVSNGILIATNASTSTWRRGIEWSVTSGQYDVRLVKQTPNATINGYSNAIQWSQLKTFQATKNNYPGQSVLSIVIKASGQLNGSLDQINLIATAKSMPYWNGTAWVTATNRNNGLSNPGAQLLKLIRGVYDPSGKLIAGLGWSDSRIDVESFKEFMVWCAEKNFKFDAFIQQPMSHFDLLTAIAYAGMGEISWPRGRIGVTWLADETVLSGVINMANIKRGSFSIAYAANDRAQEIEYGYFDRARQNTWNSLRVIAPGVTVPSSTARLSNLGITSQAHAATLARHSMAQNLYMTKTIVFEQDIEYMAYGRGSVMSMSHDLTQWGFSGRVLQAVNMAGVITLVLDEPVSPPTSGAAYLGIRLIGETKIRIFSVLPFTTKTNSIVLGESWPLDATFIGDGNNPMDAIWIYDFKQTPGQKVVILSIDPADGNTSARITATPLYDEFWNYIKTAEYIPPPDNSLLDKTPQILTGKISEMLKRQGTSFYTELTVDFTLNQNYAETQVWGAVNGGTYKLLGKTEGRSFTWVGGVDEVWKIRLIPYNGFFKGNPFFINYTVIGLRAKPSNVTGFVISGLTTNWNPVADVDLAGYKIKFNYGQNTNWDTATALHEGLITEMPYTFNSLPSGSITMLIKAVDTTGNESELPALIATQIGDQLVSNILFQQNEHTLWTGTKINSIVTGGELVATTTDLMYTPENDLMYEPEDDLFYGNDVSAALEYYWDVSTPSSGIIKLLYNFNLATYKIEYALQQDGLMYELPDELMYELGSDLMWGELTEWSPWTGQLAVTAGQQIFFRVVSNGGGIGEKLITLTTIIDVDDITISLDDVVILSTGTRLNLGQDVNGIKNVQLTVQADGNTGVTARIIDKSVSLGPLVQVLNSSGSPVNGLIDAIVQAY